MFAPLTRALIKEAGAGGVREQPIEFRIEARISTEQFWQLRSETSGTLRENLTRLTTDERTQLSREVQEAVREYFPHDLMSFPAQMIVVTGTKS